MSRGPAQRLYVALIGPGLVGRELLRQIHARFYGPPLSPPPSFSISVLVVATSKRMVCLGSATPDATLDLQADWKALLNDEGEEADAARDALLPPTMPFVLVQPTDLPAALARLTRGDVLVDCSASSHALGGDASPSGQQLHLYGQALARGISVVTPNKCFAAGPARSYEGALAAAAASAEAAEAAAAAAGDDDQSSALTGALAASAAAAQAQAAAAGLRLARAPALYLGEATVGAGLPVLSTVRDLLATGDEIKKIEGVFSGSLSFIFNTLSSSSSSSSSESESSPTTLASVVRVARDQGYTEPDPRDDLSGTDVARKAVILARALSLGRSLSNGGSGGGGGQQPPPPPPPPKLLELSDVSVRSLVPPHLSDRSKVDVEAFLTGLAADDGSVGEEVAKARLEGKVLRYVAAVTVGSAAEGGIVEAEVGLRSFANDHPYAALSGADNVFSFVTKRYPASSPLVIRGPGAGAAVTAAGVFGDLMTVARAAGASV